MKTIPDFDGVFRFTNNTAEDFVVLWDNKEYVFQAHTSSPLIIRGETLENIQEIRKKFAYKLAEREFFKSQTYYDMVEQGNKSAGGVPPIPDPKILEPWIEECLVPLPIVIAPTRVLPRDSDQNYTSKSFDDKAGIGNINEAFKDAPIEVKGEMPGGEN